MYNKIKDPISNKNYKIDSKNSLEILKKYILSLNGGFPEADEKKENEYNIILDKLKSLFTEQNNTIKSLEENNLRLEKNILDKDLKIKNFESKHYKITCFLEIIKNIYEELDWDTETGKDKSSPNEDCCLPLEFWNTVVVFLGNKSKNTKMTSTFSTK